MNEDTDKTTQDDSSRNQPENISDRNEPALIAEPKEISVAEDKSGKDNEIKEADVEKTSKSPEFEVNLDESKNEQVNVFQGETKVDNSTTNRKETNFNTFNNINLGGEKYDSKIPLIEDSKPLIYRDTAEVIENLPDFLEQLEESNILLLSDYHYGKSTAVAFQLACGLEITNLKENIRTFSLASIKNIEIDIHSFSFERKKKEENERNSTEEKIVIIIDATKTSDSFPDSLLNGELTLYQQLPGELKNNKLYLICLIPSKYIEDWLRKERKGEKGFPYWMLSERSVQKQSPEIDKKLDDLLDNLSEEEEEAIIQTVLFIGAFFPNLIVSDFIFLVELWLSREDDVRPAFNAEGNEKSKTVSITLKQLWASKPDLYFKRSFLYQDKTQDNTKFIAFIDGYDTDSAKQILERNIPIALQKKIESIAELGLIFHKSEDIANHSIELLAEYFSDSREINIDWLLRIFNFLNEVEEITETLDVLDILGAIPQQYIRNKEKESKEKNFYYSRLAKVFREMLRHESLESVIYDIFEQLIHETSYKSVLLLIKRLQFSPKFDALYWLKQLVEKGGKSFRKNIEEHLIGNLINGKIDIKYLQEWLPETDSPIERSSRTNEISLYIFIKYLMVITQNFDEKQYHHEPCRFSLFVFDDTQDVDEKLDFMVKNLLHPWREKIWEGLWEEIKEKNQLSAILFPVPLPYIYLVAWIIDTWSFILYLPPNKLKDKNRDGEDMNNSQVDNYIISDILLEKFVLYTDKEEQKEIITYWKAEKENLADIKYYGNSKSREAHLGRKVFISKLEESFTRKTFQKTNNKQVDKYGSK